MYVWMDGCVCIRIITEMKNAVTVPLILQQHRELY